MPIKTIYKIVRASAWALMFFTILEMFSGFFSSSNFVTSLFGNALTFKIHTLYIPIIFAVLFFAHSLTGFYILLLRHRKYNTLTIKSIGTMIWTIIFLSFIIMFFGQFSTATNQPSSASTPSSLNQGATINQSASQPTQSAKQILTASIIAQHNSASDCWMIISGKVYDLTKYLPQHPGGESIMLPYCGKDATQAYATKDIGRPHSSYADQLLNQYYIGNLNN